MAEAKEKTTATVKPAAKAIVATKVPAEKKEAVKAPAAPVKAETEVKKAPVKKAAPAKKETAKKAPAKKAAPVKKEAVKAIVNLQFAGKSYTDEDLVKIAKDVWKYDLGKKAADFKSVELYVKPEESRAYYVINGETTGSFAI
jgi:hypothetical protein